MSKELVVAILGVLAAVLGLLTAFVSRRKLHEIRIHGADTSAQPRGPASDVVEAVVKEASRSGDPVVARTHSPPVARKVALKIKFAGDKQLREPARNIGVTATVKLDGRSVGKGSLSGGFAVDATTKAGAHKLVLEWVYEYYTYDWHKQHLRADIPFELADAEHAILHLGYDNEKFFVSDIDYEEPPPSNKPRRRAP